MRLLVTGSSGHLGEALVRTLRDAGHAVAGLDVRPSAFTSCVGSIANRGVVDDCMGDADVVLHAATLHRPHVATRPASAFVETNVLGTLHLLEAAVATGVRAFVFTSTTSTFGNALHPGAGEPAAWITEGVRPVPRNIYGVTKTAAEDLCELFHRRHGLPCLVLRASRFFAGADDDPAAHGAVDDANLKTNELLNRRVDLQDVVDAHRLAIDRAPALGFGRYVVSATTPFEPGDAAELRVDAPSVIRRRVPQCAAIYARLGWRLPPSIGRVYDNAAARRDLGWQPQWDFARALAALNAGEPPRSPLAQLVGAKG